MSTKTDSETTTAPPVGSSVLLAGLVELYNEVSWLQREQLRKSEDALVRAEVYMRCASAIDTLKDKVERGEKSS